MKANERHWHRSAALADDFIMNLTILHPTAILCYTGSTLHDDVGEADLRNILKTDQAEHAFACRASQGQDLEDRPWEKIAPPRA